MEKIRYCCPCFFGLESVLAFEIKKLGGENLAVSDGRVSFDGDISMIAKANICLFVAERVLIELGSFPAESFEQLFQGVKSLPLERFIGKQDEFPVKGSALKSKLHSIPDCQSIVKKAAVERLKSVYHINRFEETGPRHQIQFHIFKDIASIYLDTTGQPLHKRGYRRQSNEAPIRETLAAGIMDFARIRSDSIVNDPMCGSGTFLIEAAYRALRIAPGIMRDFSAERWESIPGSVWSDERSAAHAAIDKQAGFKGIGGDIDPGAVELTLRNAKYARVSSRISASVSDISDFRPADGTITVVNPPYGERLLELRQAEELYRRLGQVLSPSEERPCYIISPHEDFEKLFGKKADKRRKLYNGMIKCQLYMYYS